MKQKIHKNNAMNLPSKALTAEVVLATGAGAKAAAEPMMVAMIADFIFDVIIVLINKL